MTKIAIIGAGPAGIMAAIVAKENDPTLEIVVFDKSDPLKTLLYTGGGRCNLGFYEFDIKEFASNYPRGEKFLYSVFNKFCTGELLSFLSNIGIETYAQEDQRIFPISNSAKDVRSRLLERAKSLGVKIKARTEIKKIDRIKGSGFIINGEKFSKIVISTGGKYKDQRYNGFYFASKLGHKINKLKSALSGLKIKENWLNELSGVSLDNIEAHCVFKGNEKTLKYELCDDLLFTHSGISGPLAYKISSIFAFCDYSFQSPIEISLNFTGKTFEEIDALLLEGLDTDSKKSIKNTIAEFIPKSLVMALLEENNIDPDKKNSQINKIERKKIAEFLSALNLQAIAPVKDGEIVTAGGVSLDEIIPSTMESKLVSGLYFCGEVLNIDGFTGGFNLQACFSTGYIVGNSL